MAGEEFDNINTEKEPDVHMTKILKVVVLVGPDCECAGVASDEQAAKERALEDYYGPENDSSDDSKFTDHYCIEIEVPVRTDRGMIRGRFVPNA